MATSSRDAGRRFGSRRVLLFIVSEKINQLIYQCPRLELYLDNGFRRLGLRAPADTRAVVRRVDKLRVPVELGQAVGGWAFAPADQTSVEALRAVTRRLQEPMRRLLDEFFWFWPLSYPNSGDDAALDSLMSGDTAAATAAWSEAAGRGDTAGWHNLAVYQHLLALEWLDSTEVDAETARALWRDATAYWQRVLADDGAWSRVAGRIEAINDPQLPVSAAGLLREALPSVLARINALAAARLAARGQVEAAGFQLGCVATLLPAGDIAALLDPLVQPLCRRLATHLSEARRAGPPREGELTALWAAVQSDLGALQGLGETVSESCAEQQRLLAEVLFARIEAGLAGNTRPASAFLVHVLILLDLAPAGPAADRAGRLFSDVLLRAIHAGDARGGEGERIRLLLRDAVMPSAARLALTPRLRAALHARLAGWLQQLAETAVSTSPAMMPWALQVLGLAATLPLDADSRFALDSTLASWAAEPRSYRRPALVLTAGGRTLRIDVVGVTLDGARIEASQLTGVCHPLPGFGHDSPTLLRWSDASRVVELPTEFLEPADVFQNVLTTLHQLILPNLTQRILGAIRGGANVQVGPLQLHAGGIFTTDSSKARPYASLRLATDRDGVTLRDDSDPDFVLKLDPANDWNVSLLPLLILILTPR
ncbi:MAG: hypothetical protein ABII82_12800 [Verrucomicrobiota bacterium]